MLRSEIIGLRCKKQILRYHLKPWSDEALKLSQDLEGGMRQLNQTLDNVTTSTAGPTLQKLVEIA